MITLTLLSYSQHLHPADACLPLWNSMTQTAEPSGWSQPYLLAEHVSISRAAAAKDLGRRHRNFSQAASRECLHMGFRSQANRQVSL